MQQYKSSYIKKRRVSPKIYYISFFVIISLAILIFFQFNRIQLCFKGYNLTEQNMILNLNKEEINKYIKQEKIDNLENWKNHQNQSHYKEYELYSQTHKELNQEQVIEYIDKFYKNYYSSLKNLNYPDEALNKMMRTASLDDFDFIISNQYTHDKAKEYIQIKGMIYSDLPQYFNNHSTPLKNVLSVSYPFINSQNKPKTTYQILDPSPIELLIKKGFQLPDKYQPNDLVIPHITIAPDCQNAKLRKIAASGLEEMANDASKVGLKIAIKSAYRSYTEQKEIYDEYFKKYDAKTASSLVAIPGSSEHQLGLSVDLTSQSIIDGQKRFFGDTKEYQWVIKNAYKYGYILRYPSNKSNITGTTNEPWHFRYVGMDIAKIIYDNQWTLEDYTIHYGLASENKKN